MVAKAEWGTKQTCPKCSVRFYDLGKTPAVCVSCEHTFVPEPILKSKQPTPEAERKPVKSKEPEAVGVDGDDVIDDDVDPIADVSLDDEDAELDDIVDDSLDEV